MSGESSRPQMTDSSPSALSASRRMTILVLTLWVLALAASALVAPRLSRTFDDRGTAASSESDRARQAIAHEFPGQDADQYYIVFTSPRLRAVSPQFAKAALASLEKVRRLRGVSRVTSYWEGHQTIAGQHTVSGDGHSAIAVISTRDKSMLDARERLLPAVRKAVTLLPHDIKAHVTGETPIMADMEQASDDALARSERIAVPVVLTILLLMFGSVISALIPLGLGFVSVTVGSGLFSIYAHFFAADNIATSVISMLGMGVGVDYSLFLVSRFSEELKAGKGVDWATRRTMATSGKAIAISGLAVMISLASLFIVGNPLFRSIAVGAVLVVVVSVLAVVTLLPIAFRVLGPRVFALAIPLAKGVVTGQNGRFWHNWALAVMKRPWAFAALATIPLAVLAAPLSGMRTGQPALSVLPRNADSRIGAELLKTDFGIGSTQPIDIVIEVRKGTVADSDNLPRLYRLARRISREDGVGTLMSHVSLNPDWNLAKYRSTYIDAPTQLGQLVAMLSGGRLSLSTVSPIFGRGDAGLRLVAESGGAEAKEGLPQLVNLDKGADVAHFVLLPSTSGDSPKTIRLIERLRTDILPVDVKGWGTALVGGAPARFVDFTAQINHSLPWIITIVLILTYIMLTLLLRSVLLPLKAIAMNILSVGAAYGALVIVFQEGHLSSLLGFTPLGYVTPISVMLLFCALFGLSMDYEVFLLTRVKEAHDEGHTNEESLALGLERTAGIITGAAAIMVCVFAAFVAGGILMVKEIGFGLAVSILLDATLIRIVLVPAFMRLMGDWNWWLPKWLSDAMPRVDVGH